MKWIKQVVGLLILGLLVVGCKHKQPLVSQGEVDLTRNTAQEVLRMEPSFKSMHISKMSMRVMTDRAEFTFKAVVKMHTDSLVSISVLPALGVEMVRTTFTPSGFLIVDQWNRKYSLDTYDYFTSKRGLLIAYGSLDR